MSNVGVLGLSVAWSEIDNFGQKDSKQALAFNKQACSKNAKGTKFRPLKLSWFCLSYLEIFQNICLFNAYTEHSTSNLVFETRGILYLFWECSYTLSGNEVIAAVQ